MALLDALWQDLNYVLRRIRQSPGFTAMVVLTLALGLGANAAIFSLLDRMFLRAPAGVAQPREVRRLRQDYHPPAGTFSSGPLTGIRTYYNYPELRNLVSAMPEGVSMAGYWGSYVHFGQAADAPKGVATYVVGEYFGLLGVRPAIGRLFTAEELRVENVTRLAVISHQLWMRRFSGAGDILGRSLEIASSRYTIIGVTPPAFRGIDLTATDVWVPMNTTISFMNDGLPWHEELHAFTIRIITRVQSTAVARRVETVATRILRDRPSVGDTTATVSLTSVVEAETPDHGATAAATSTRLGGVAAIVLLIACANVANLLLARGLQRRRETAIRLALGVSRKRLVMQLLTESVVLGVIGGAVALQVAVWGATLLRQALLPDIRWGDQAIDLRVAVFTAVAAVLTGLGAGLAPALQASRPDLNDALKAGAREGTVRRSGLRAALLVTQTALSVVLLAGAGLFVRSLRNVASADIGYDADRLVLASVWWDRKLGNYDLQITQGLPVIAGQLARVPGVERVSLVDEAPFEGFGPSRVYLPGKDTIPGLNGMLPMRSVVSAEFFETAGVHVLKGRGFSADDRIGQELVAAVSGLMAKKFWPAEDPLGKCIIIGKRTDPCRRVVGVVSETHYTRILEEPSMHVYVPLAQSPEVTPHAVVIRVAPGRRDGVYARARALLESLGPWANLRIESMTGILAPELRPWRVGAGLVSAAGLLALVVAIVGVYSSISYTVSQRRHEMGVRAALGARAPAIMRLVIGQGVRVVTVGVVCGVGIALALGKLLASLLYGVTPHDPAVLAVASLVLIVVAAGASAVPAWRSTRVDPVEALRAE